MKLACGCDGEWRTDKMVPTAEEIRDRGCPCCGAPPGKLCAAARGGVLESNGKRPGIKWMYVCFARVESPLSLL